MINQCVISPDRFVSENFPYIFMLDTHWRSFDINSIFSRTIWYGLKMDESSVKVFLDSQYFTGLIAKMTDMFEHVACLEYTECRSDVSEYIEVGLDGRWIMCYGAIAFRNEQDALMFKLMDQ